MVAPECLGQSAVGNLGGHLLVASRGDRNVLEAEASPLQKRCNQNLEGQGRAVIHVRLVAADRFTCLCTDHTTVRVGICCKEIIPRFIQIEANDASER